MGSALLVGPDRDRRAVGVAARDHQHVVALHAVVTGEDVGAQVATGDVTQVKGTVGIGPSHGHKYAFWQGGISRYDLRSMCGYSSIRRVGSPKVGGLRFALP